MNLTIDIGNTRSKIGLFKNGKMLHRETWPALTVEALKMLAYNHPFQNAILCSVATVPPEAEFFLKNHGYYLQLDTQTPLPFPVQYATPHTLGKDRLAAAAGAFRAFSGKTCVVIDAGTCITMDVLHASEGYLGGNIAPGVAMRLRAMHHFTAQLPEVKPALADFSKNEWLGGSTRQALLNGAQLGALLETEGFVRLCRQQFGPLKVVCTGGDADFFVKHFKTRIFARPNLVLEGLYQILNYNVQLSEGFQR